MRKRKKEKENIIIFPEGQKEPDKPNTAEGQGLGSHFLLSLLKR